jgi:hypothetical protein
MPLCESYAKWDKDVPLKKFQASIPLDDANYLNETYGQDTENGVLLSFSRILTEAITGLSYLKSLKG